MPETHFDEWIAEHYDNLWPELFEPAFIEPSLDVLADLAGGGPALEFGIGTGRIALPLSQRGVTVHGIELSTPMITRLRAQAGASNVGVTLGDFATATVEGSFSLVYLLRNTITNLTSQDEQVECFRNAARHLRPGGVFLIENYVPELQRIPPGETTHVFTATPTHIGVGEYDIVDQIEVSRHWWASCGPSPRHTDMYGRPSLTSWRVSPEWDSGGADGSVRPSIAAAAHTSPYGRRPRSRRQVAVVGARLRHAQIEARVDSADSRHALPTGDGRARPAVSG